MHLSWHFSANACYKVVVRSVKSENWESRTFPCRSLLLSTTVLNDKLTGTKSQQTKVSLLLYNPSFKLSCNLHNSVISTIHYIVLLFTTLLHGLHQSHMNPHDDI